MERIREKMLELFKNNRIGIMDIDYKYRYMSFITTKGAGYTFVPVKGNCINSTKCSEDVIKIYAGNIQYAKDIAKLEDCLEERCIKCILNTLEEDRFEIYENFGLE